MTKCGNGVGWWGLEAEPSAHPDVLVEASALDSAHRSRGIGRYVSGLLSGLVQLADAGTEVDGVSLAALRLGGPWRTTKHGSEAVAAELDARDGSLPEYRVGRPPIDHLGRWLANEFALPGEVAGTGADLFHATEPWSMIVSEAFSTVATVHDLIPLKFPDRYFTLDGGGPAKWLYYRAMEAVGRWHRCDRLIAISRATKRSLIRFLDVDPDRVAVIPNGIDTDAFRRVEDLDERRRVAREYGVSPPFVLYLGGFDYRKNVETLVRALPRLPDDVSVVLGGQIDPNRETELRRLAERIGCSRRLQCIGYIDESDLNALYSAASAFAYPSLAEGFGLQVLEAMAAGCPVVAGFATSLPEVVGDAGRLVNPSDPRDLGDALREIVTDDDLRRALRRRGRERVERFSWRRTASQTLDVYKSVLREQA